MTMFKIAGFVAAGAGLLALVGGGVWWLRRHQASDGASGDVPRRAPGRAPIPDDHDDLQPDQRPSRAHLTKPRGHYIEREGLDPDLTEVLNGLFEQGWPPDEETLNNLEQDDVIVFAVESEETGNYDMIQRELVSAKVLSVGKSEIRARIYGEVKHAEHLGSHAGHGFRIGDLVEIPRSKVLVAAKRADMDSTGYGSQGNAAETLEPSSVTEKVYTVRPGTPYDLMLPYRTDALVWLVDRELVKLNHVGHHRLVEQIMFSEDSLRGEVSVRALDKDPKEGTTFVARWDFAIES